MKKTLAAVLAATSFIVSAPVLANDKPAIEPQRDIFAVESRNLAQEEANKKLVVDWYNDVFTRHDLSTTDQILAENYIQHSPKLPNGRETVKNALKDRIAKNPERQTKLSVRLQRAIWCGCMYIPQKNQKNAAVPL